MANIEFYMIVRVIGSKALYWAMANGDYDPLEVINVRLDGERICVAEVLVPPVCYHSDEEEALDVFLRGTSGEVEVITNG